MIKVLRRRIFETFWQIMAGFRQTNLKFRNLTGWIIILAVL